MMCSDIYKEASSRLRSQISIARNRDDLFSDGILEFESLILRLDHLRLQPIKSSFDKILAYSKNRNSSQLNFLKDSYYNRNSFNFEND